MKYKRIFVGLLLILCMVITACSQSGKAEKNSENSITAASEMSAVSAESAALTELDVSVESGTLTEEGDLLLTSPPVIGLSDMLSGTLNEFSLQSGSYEWSVMGNGQVQEVAACGSHPLDMTMENYDRLKVPKYNQLDAVLYRLSCVIPPDSVTVTVWDEESLGETETKAESVTVYEDQTMIELKPGKVYELSAEWSRDKLEERGFSGTASYAFLTE